MLFRSRRKTKIQTQIEQVMDLEKTKKKKYKMKVEESWPWLGSLNESERDIKTLHERERERVGCCVGFILIFWVCVLCLFSCLI